MKISKIKIKNFRKLEDCTISIFDKTTLFVGANNSGKTSAMYCLMAFLGSNEKRFKVTDFPLNKIELIDKFSAAWSIDEIQHFCPTLEISLDDIQDSDLPKIKHIIPSLSWNNEEISIRLLFEPKDIDILKEKFSEYVGSIDSLLDDADDLLFPRNLWGFLNIGNNLRDHPEFCVTAI